MALFGWDTSHFDGTLTEDRLRRAKSEGITFFTAKVGEGLTFTDPNFKASINSARAAGIEFIGAYYVLHSTNPIGQADRCVALADQFAPWWRSYPGWFWQGDFEHWPDDFPSPSACIAFCDRLAERSGCLVVAYASQGQYGNTLGGLNHPLWNANYRSSRQVPFKDLYPGDGGIGWASYSGKVPVFWQYASSATIAGLTTCDANAFRGTVDDLRSLISGGNMPLSQTDLTNIKNVIGGGPGSLTIDGIVSWIAQGVDNRTGKPVAGSIPGLTSLVTGMAADIAAIKVSETSSLAAIQAVLAQVQASGGSIDSAPILAAIQAARDEAHASFIALQQENADLKEENVELRKQVTEFEAKLAAAAAALVGQ